MNLMKWLLVIALGVSASVHAMENNNPQENKPAEAYTESEEQKAEKAAFIENMRMVKAMRTCMDLAYSDLYIMAVLLQTGAANNTYKGCLNSMWKEGDYKMHTCLMQKEREARNLRDAQ